MEAKELLEKINDGYRVSLDEAVSLAEKLSIDDLCDVAGALREKNHGKYFDSCSIMNARSGRCSEDCKWCSQSKFHNTNVDIYPLVTPSEAVEQALYNAGKGIRRFSLVTSGRTMSDSETDRCCEIYRSIREKTPIYLCASMGLLTKEQLQRLYESGVRRYHCNLESSPSYFPTLCTTHTTAEKIATIRWAQEVGMDVCSGGIIGMGESRRDRFELAVTLRDLNIKSIPVNVLNPIAGTPLEGTAPLSDSEVLMTMAMFRIINPDAHIRLAGGRAAYNHLMPRLIRCGVSASIMGDMLTTVGSDIDSDKSLLQNNGFEL